MATDPDLATPNEMMVYAIIDSFSQSKEGWFMGGIPYLMEWTKLSRSSIARILKSLKDKEKILTESNKEVGCVTVNKYRTNREKSQKMDNSHECQIDTREKETPVQNECQNDTRETPTSVKLTQHDVRLTPHDVRLTPHECQIDTREKETPVQNECQNDTRETPTSVKLTQHDVRLTPHDVRLTPHECQIDTQVIQSSNTTSNSISNKDDRRKIEFLVSLLKSMSINKNGHNNPNIAKDFKHAVKSLTDDLHPHPEFEIVYAWERYQKEREETVSDKKYMPNLATWLENGCVPTVYEKRLSRYWDRKYRKQYERIKSKYPN